MSIRYSLFVIRFMIKCYIFLPSQNNNKDENLNKSNHSEAFIFCVITYFVSLFYDMNIITIMDSNERLSNLKKRIEKLKEIPANLQYTSQQMTERLEKFKKSSKLLEELRKQNEAKRKQYEENKQKVQSHFFIHHKLIKFTQISHQQKETQIQAPLIIKETIKQDQNKKIQTVGINQNQKIVLTDKNNINLLTEAQDEKKIKEDKVFEANPNQNNSANKSKFRRTMSLTADPLTQQPQTGKYSRIGSLFGEKQEKIQKEGDVRNIFKKKKMVFQNATQTLDIKQAYNLNPGVYTQPQSSLASQKEQNSNNSKETLKQQIVEKVQCNHYQIEKNQQNALPPPKPLNIFKQKDQKEKQENIQPIRKPNIFSNFEKKINNSDNQEPILTRQPIKNHFNTNIRESKKDQQKQITIINPKQKTTIPTFKEINQSPIKQPTINRINIFKTNNNQKEQQKKQQLPPPQIPLPTVKPQQIKNIFSQKLFPQQKGNPKIEPKKENQRNVRLCRIQSSQQSKTDKHDQKSQAINIFSSSVQSPVSTQVNIFKRTSNNNNFFSGNTNSESKIFGSNPIQPIKLINSFATKSQKNTQLVENGQDDEDEGEEGDDNDSLLAFQDKADPSKSNFHYEYQKPEIIFKCSIDRAKINGVLEIKENLSLQKLPNTNDIYLYIKTVTNTIRYCGKIIKQTKVKEEMNPTIANIQYLVNCTPGKTTGEKITFDPVKIKFLKEQDRQFFKQSLQKCKPN